MIWISGFACGIVVAIHEEVHSDLLDQVLADAPDAHVVIDVRDSAAIQPDGLAALSRVAERARSHRGGLVLSSPYGDIRRVLEGEGLRTVAS